MFERFTERARQVVALAQEEARDLKHDYIGTEHLLLGLLREKEGLAARVLDSLDVGVARVRNQVREIVREGDEVPTGPIPFTLNAKNVMEKALREALSLGHNYIGTEHILLGFASAHEGVGPRILREAGVDPETIRDKITRVIFPLDRPERCTPTLALIALLSAIDAHARCQHDNCDSCRNDIEAARQLAQQVLA